MNVQNLKLQFSNPESRPSNVVRTQIPVARFGLSRRSSSTSASDFGVSNGTPEATLGHRKTSSTSSEFIFNNRNSSTPPSDVKPSYRNSTSPVSKFSFDNRSSSTPSSDGKPFYRNSTSPSSNSTFDNRNSSDVKPLYRNSTSPAPNSTFGNRNSSHSRSSDNLINGNSYTSYTSYSPRTPQTPVQPLSSPTSALQPLDKWKGKYEEAERKRKSLLTQNQKLSRDQEDLQRRYSLVQRELDTCRRDLADKDAKLNQLRKLSEAVYKEYDQLKNQYELETGSMQKAMQKASQWYKENRELKRRSTALVQRVMQVAPETINNFADDTDSGVSTDNDDFEDLRKTVHELTQDVAKLQAEVNAARLQEFEAQETIVDLSSQLDEERNARVLLESELKELRSLRDNVGQVSRMVAAEVSSLREQCEREKETAQRMKQDADKAKTERNVLAHQSQLLMCEVADDQRLLQLLLEVESLKRNLEEEQQKHAADVQALQEKLEEREGDAQLELLEEKLKLAESELQRALERAERAESVSQQLLSKVNQLEKELTCKSQVPPPPAPPLPPPPPPMPSLATPSTTPIALRKRPSCEGAETTSSAVLQMANLLGIPRRTAKPPDAPGAIDDIINQIKGGRFVLKSTEPKQRLPKVEEKPPVVQEMINVLGTLRKRRTPSMRRQLERTHHDVQL